jgi:hypothetical protein
VLRGRESYFVFTTDADKRRPAIFRSRGVHPLVAGKYFELIFVLDRAISIREPSLCLILMLENLGQKRGCTRFS